MKSISLVTQYLPYKLGDSISTQEVLEITTTAEIRPVLLEDPGVIQQILTQDGSIVIFLSAVSYYFSSS